MLPPQLGDEQINCGPDWPDDIAPDGRVRSLATPVGEYDLASVAAKLSPEQQPDVVVGLVDASWRNLPRNLAAFKCPRVLLVADTHHLNSPVIGMLRYFSAEIFDRIVLLYDRHHAALFHAAGFRNLYWFPGLTFPHDDTTVKAARQDSRQPHVAFVGQTGQYHPRRAQLVAALTTGGVPVLAQSLPQCAALRHYGSSLLGFNASLNGDLNLRVFEVLAAGSALLTDQLAPAAGLARLWTDERQLATYRNAGELVERARHYLDHPDLARALGAAGAGWFDAHFSQAQRRAYFEQIVFNGVAPELFAWSDEEHRRVLFDGDTDRLLQSLLVYESMQEQHRTQEVVHVLLEEDAPKDIGEICATLPRVQLASTADATAVDWAVVGTARCESFLQPVTSRLWCWDARADAAAALDAKLATTGFVRLNADVAVYGRAPEAASQPPATTETQPGRPQLKSGTCSPLPVGRRICITFGGEVYDGTTALAAMLAPKLGADEVWVYDDNWLINHRPEFYELNRWLWEHHHKRGFGWYAWKPFILIDALDKLAEGDVVLYFDADTFPVDDFSMLYETCARDGGIMLFKAGGNVSQRFTQGQWCKRDCFIVMNQDEERYHQAEAGVARFMLFQKGPWRARQFLMEWLTYCVNPLATTFDPSVLAKEVPGFVEHRTEQAIMTNLAHKYGLRLYREACELGNSFPEDQGMYPQLFSQLNPWGNKTAPCVGSKFRNVS